MRLFPAKFRRSQVPPLFDQLMGTDENIFHLLALKHSPNPFGQLRQLHKPADHDFQYQLLDNPAAVAGKATDGKCTLHHTKLKDLQDIDSTWTAFGRRATMLSTSLWM